MNFKNYTEFLNEALDPSKFLTQEQIDWCDKHIDGKWGVNEKGEVTVRKKNVGFKDRSFDRFPVQFTPVKGTFDCSRCPNLVSLKGAPAHVGESFWCRGCPKLTSLEGAPSHVGGDFNCENCPKLASLEGAPAHVGGYFYCGNCPELPVTFVEIIKDYNEEEIDWKTAHKLIHSETARTAHAIGLI